MKKNITFMTVATLLLFVFGCKKSDTQQPQTTLQKIQAKWQLQTYLENDHYSGIDHITNSPGSTNDYLDFRSDGKVYVSLFGSKDTSTYSILNDTKIIFDSYALFDIKTLTANSFIMYGKQTYGSSDFDEQTYTMIK